jgi:hypothetical protein
MGKHIKLVLFEKGVDEIKAGKQSCADCIHQPTCRFLWHLWQMPAPENEPVTVTFNCPFYITYYG